MSITGAMTTEGHVYWEVLLNLPSLFHPHCRCLQQSLFLSLLDWWNVPITSSPPFNFPVAITYFELQS